MHPSVEQETEIKFVNYEPFFDNSVRLAATPSLATEPTLVHNKSLRCKIKNQLERALAYPKTAIHFE